MIKIFLNSTLILLSLISCKENEPRLDYRSLNFSKKESESKKVNGIIEPYKYKPIDKAIMVGCNFFDLDMVLITALTNGVFCKPIKLDNKWFYLAHSREGFLRLLNSNDEIIWEVEGEFNHDISYDYDDKKIYAIDNFKKKINNITYRYAGIRVINIEGTVLGMWDITQSQDKLSQMTNLENDENNVPYPIMKRLEPNKKVVNRANYIHVLEEDWHHLKKGTILIYYVFINALVAVDKNFEILWHHNFWKIPNNRDFFLIHTPELTNDGKLIFFNNSIDVDGESRSGISIQKSDENNKIENYFLVPKVFPNQFNHGLLGNIQLFVDGSIFLSTGSEYGGMIHLDKDKNVLFHWINPRLDPESKISTTIYRANLIPLDWVPIRN